MNSQKGGQPNISGINSQIWASMSLFLQFLRDPSFLHIHLEAPGFQDFNLVFNDGHKIICESKDRKKAFNYNDLRKILRNLDGNKVVGVKDEILIVCTSASDALISDIKYIKYFPKITSKFKKKSYKDSEIDLIPKVKFWIVRPTFNKKVIYSLFSDLVNFWLPPIDLERIVDNLLVQKMYNGAASGLTYSKTEILKDINDLSVKAKKDSVFYDNDLKKREQQFRTLNQALNNPKHLIWTKPKELSAFSTDYERLKFATSRLINKKDSLILENWDPIFQLNRVYSFTYGIFQIFENNLHLEENKAYVLGYIKKYTKTVRGFYQADFFNSNVAKIISKIVSGPESKKYINNSFEIISDLISFNETDFFYLKEIGYDHSQWEKGNICKLLHDIYKLADNTLKEKIFKLLITTFNITEDEGQFSHHSPREVFAIISDWLEEDFVGRFKKIVKTISNQYEQYYKQFGKKIKFVGWEHMGGGISYSGGYHAHDRHFIGILEPAILKYYIKNSDIGWKFIKDNCISDDNKVEKYRPDFLNRSVYNIVLERYIDDDDTKSKEAFSILEKFILSRRGVPHKSDLIYQAVANSGKISSYKKWKIVELTTKKYGIPVNPFAEQIVASLAKSGLKEAKDELKKWFNDKRYYQRFNFGDDAVVTIKTLMQNDFDFAFELLMALLKSDYFKSGKSDTLSPFVVADLIYDILCKKYPKGIEVLKWLSAEQSLSKDQQSILYFSLYNSRGNDDSDDINIITNIYVDIVDPILNSLNNDISRILLRISSDGARSSIIQFAVRLAQKKKIAEALRIIRVFINDPDPYLPGKDPSDPKNDYNENKRIDEGKQPSSITSVRGWCGWALMKCAVVEGRDQMPEIIELSKKLALSEKNNYYMIHMACFAIAQISRNRLTVLPSDKNTLFLNDKKGVALQLAKDIENIAFELLDNLLAWPKIIQEAMAHSILHVFDSIRALNENDALRFVNNLTLLPIEVTDEYTPLLIYYAEFRKYEYKNWKFSLPGLYDDLGPDKYDDKKFKTILMNHIKEIQKKDPDKCFRIAASFEHIIREMTPSDPDFEKCTKMAIKYFELLTGVYAHNIYNLIYQIIQSKFTNPDKHINKWYGLFLKCLKIEKGFFEKEIKAGNTAKIYWYPALYHSDILESAYKNLGQDKFMTLAKIFFSFPKQLELQESDGLVSLIRDLSKTEKEAEVIIKYLKDKNPTKYFDLK